MLIGGSPTCARRTTLSLKRGRIPAGQLLGAQLSFRRARTRDGSVMNGIALTTPLIPFAARS